MNIIKLILKIILSIFVFIISITAYILFPILYLFYNLMAYATNDDLISLKEYFKMFNFIEIIKILFY